MDGIKSEYSSIPDSSEVDVKHVGKSTIVDDCDFTWIEFHHGRLGF
jgi:hypothetical protein